MADKQMELLVKIKAQGADALNKLNKMQGTMRKISSTGKRMGSLVSAGLSGIRKGVGLLLVPLKRAAIMSTALALTFTTLSLKGLNASGDIEALKLRLEGVTASAEDANRVFKETLNLSITSPFTPEEMVDARIGLLNIGQAGKGALENIGDAAAITQRPLVDLVSVLASLETEPLRRIGIELKRAGGSFEFTFRDKMQKVKSITAKGIDDARKALLSIFDVKYKRGMARFAEAWKGLVSTLQGNVKLAFANFGEGLMPAAKDFTDQINERLSKMTETGTFKEWGAAAAVKITKAFDFVRAVVERTINIWGDIMKFGPKQMKNSVAAIFSGAAKIFMVGLVNGVSGISGVFVGLARLMAGVFGDQILSIVQDLPLGDKLIRKMAERKLSSVGAEGGQEIVKDLGFNSAAELSRAMRQKGPAGTNINRRIVTSGGTRAFTEGIEGARTAIPESFEKTKREVARILRDEIGPSIGTQFGTGGASVEERFEAFQSARRQRIAEREVPKTELITGRKSTIDSAGRESFIQEKTAEVEAGKFEVGQTTASGFTIIKVEKLTVKANDLTKLQNELVMKGKTPALASAST